MSDRYEVMREWSRGFVAAISCDGIDDAASEHFKAGYLAGFKMRTDKNAKLDEYLESLGMKKQCRISTQ